MQTQKKNAAHQLRDIVGNQTRVAEALGISDTYFSNMVRGKRSVPLYINALKELLEIVPYKDWPKRWRA